MAPQPSTVAASTSEKIRTGMTTPEVSARRRRGLSAAAVGLSYDTVTVRWRTLSSPTVFIPSMPG